MRKARKSKIHPLSHARKQRINPAIATAIIIPRRLNCMRDRVSIRQAARTVFDLHHNLLAGRFLSNSRSQTPSNDEVELAFIFGGAGTMKSIRSSPPRGHQRQPHFLRNVYNCLFVLMLLLAGRVSRS